MEEVKELKIKYLKEEGRLPAGFTFLDCAENANAVRLQVTGNSTGTTVWICGNSFKFALKSVRCTTTPLKNFEM